MKYFFYKLIPPRATFPQDITPAEAEMMQRHIAYWSGLLARGSVVAFGPVADPNGVYGVAILEVSGEAEADQLIAGDPAIMSNAGFRAERMAMPRANVRASTAAD
jgi:uncharacterized protein YciI